MPLYPDQNQAKSNRCFGSALGSGPPDNLCGSRHGGQGARLPSFTLLHRGVQTTILIKRLLSLVWDGSFGNEHCLKLLRELSMKYDTDSWREASW
jgi:hypothetical protein